MTMERKQVILINKMSHREYRVDHVEPRHKAVTICLAAGVKMTLPLGKDAGWKLKERGGES